MLLLFVVSFDEGQASASVGFKTTSINMVEVFVFLFGPNSTRLGAFVCLRPETSWRERETRREEKKS